MSFKWVILAVILLLIALTIVDELWPGSEYEYWSSPEEEACFEQLLDLGDTYINGVFTDPEKYVDFVRDCPGSNSDYREFLMPPLP